MSYQDKFSRWHIKPCIDGEPSSNNGWIYTAFAFHLGLGLDLFELEDCYQASNRGVWPKVDRSPGKMFPPLSRDEVLGLYICGMIHLKTIERSYWQFCNLVGFTPKPLWKINLFKALKAAWKIRKSHRNALWDEEDLWHLGFRLPPQDTWFVLKVAELSPSLIHTLYFYVSSLLTVLGKDDSGILILWVKLKELKMEGSWLYKKLKWENAIRNTFAVDHDFVKALK